MLITDGPSDTFMEVIKHYNHPHMPVRIFTYLIGTDKSGGKNLYKMACENKGRSGPGEFSAAIERRELEFSRGI